MRYSYLFVSVFLSLLFSSNSDKYTLIISFDGFRYDYLKNVDTPNFDKFKKSGVSSSLVPIFPSLTFPNHYSIATGCYADEHKILGNTFYSESLNKKYSMGDSESVQNGEFYGMEPIWVTAEKNNLISATYYWIGSEAKIGDYRPSIYKEYDGSVSFKSRVDSVVSWYSASIDKRPNLTMLYFSEPDYTGHSYGPNSKEINLSIIEMDNLLGYIISQLKELEIYEKLDIIIVSDHGMTDVSEDRLILLDKHINLKDFEMILSPAIAHLKLKDDSKVDQLYIYKDIYNANAYHRENFPKNYHFLNNDSPDYIIVADLGWTITTSSKIKQKKNFPGGMHGYDSKYTSMHGVFFASGPSFKQNIVVDSFENINIYPIICRTLEITPYINSIYWDQSLIKEVFVVE